VDPDPGCLFFYSSRIPDPGVKKAPDPGSAILKITLPFLISVCRLWAEGSSGDSAECGSECSRQG
jgi:hypothetical protein